MNHDFYPNLNKLPMPLKALLVGGGFALAGCGASHENVSSQTAPNTAAPITAADGHKSTPKAEATSTPVSNVEIQTAGSAYAREPGTAEDVIVDASVTQLWMKNNGVTPDQLKQALESDGATISQAPDTHLNGDNHDLIKAKDEVPQGMDLQYQVDTTDNVTH
jgi:hypothetical protein